MDQISEAFGELAEYAKRKGVKNIGALPGLWEFTFSHDGREWAVKVNGHAEEIAGVAGYHAVAECNGWPALMMSPRNGISLCDYDGQVRAEDLFIDAIKAQV